MLRRLVSLVLLAWTLGFIVFAVTLPGAAGTGAAGADKSDAIVVLTGAEGRIDRGLEMLRNKSSGRLLVAGVDPEVKQGEFAAHYHIEAALMQCCISLGYQSVDTRSNAIEVADWVKQHGVGSIRLVTSDWHMRRARWELAQRLAGGRLASGRLASGRLAGGIRVIEDAVPTHPTFNTLLLEYNKLLARRIAHLWGR